MNQLHKDERGATAVLVAVSLLMLLGFTALVVDVGAGFNERRQDQTAADVSVMAGALELAGTEDDIIAKAMEFADRNVGATIGLGDWLACTNPNMDSYGPDFTALTDSSGNSYPCISAARNGFLQVKIPDQTINTTFGRLLGVNQLTVNAFAIAQVAPGEGGGILPFGLTSGAGYGTLCLRTGPSGTVVPPCDTADPQTGNFFIIDSPLLENEEMGTTGTPLICNGQNQYRYSSNVALGLDHLVKIHITGEPLRPDDCSAILPPNQLFVAPGDGLDLRPGLISNNTYSGVSSRLQQLPTATTPIRKMRDGNNAVNTMTLDNRPLWHYLPSGAASNLCARDHYATASPPLTAAEVQTDLNSCLTGSSPLTWQFDPSIRDSPRLVQVPRFLEPTWPSGASELRTIAGLEGIFIHGLYFGCNGSTCDIEFFPDNINYTDPDDELCAPAGPLNCQPVPGLTQLTSFVLPPETLPAGTFPNNGPNGSLNVAEPKLWR